MKPSRRFILIFLILSLVTLALPETAGAFPPLPSSLYGKVKVDGANVPDGTLLEAWINERVVASCITQAYQADSVYSIDIPGDDTSTQEVEGGVEGDVINFKLAGILVDQTAAWHSGTNQNLDLSVTSEPTSPSQSTATPTTEQAGQDPNNPMVTATAQPQPTNAPGEPTYTPDSGSTEQPGVLEKPPPGNATATFRPGVVEIVDESYPPTATPEPGAQELAEPAVPTSPANETAEDGTLSIYWVLVPGFFLCVWLFGLWYLKHKNPG